MVAKRVSRVPPEDIIDIEGACEHNLKHVHVQVPKHQLVVFTGVSGSGKSSLAFDTLFAEGQRRYVESLSSYARQFLGQMDKPHYESIHGLTPTIAIDQKSASSNPRSTVGTITEIYDYLRVLMARVGVQTCYQCGREVASQGPTRIIRDLLALPDGTRIILLAPVVRERKGEHRDILESLQHRGFARVRLDGRTVMLEDKILLDKKKKHTIEVVVDRLIAGPDLKNRLADSVETALKTGQGLMQVDVGDGEERFYSEHRACHHCSISYPELTPQLFSFNSPMGMCPACNGLGTKIEMDPSKVVPDPSLSLAEGAIEPWASTIADRKGWTWKIVQNICQHFDIPFDVPLKQLPPEKLNVLLYGTGDEKIAFHVAGQATEHRFRAKVEGIMNTLARRLKQTQSEEARQYYMKYFSGEACTACHGERLRVEARWVRVGGKRLPEMTQMTIHQLHRFLSTLTLRGNQKAIAHELLREIRNRLGFLLNVGLEYLTLDRSGPSLSGGESQRIRLASQVGTELTGVTYILDEPSIGLHQRDNQRLIQTLKRLRDLGNTVVVVEHDRETIESADHIIDFGPGAGIHGGEVVFAGTMGDLKTCQRSLTGQYLVGTLSIPIPAERRVPDGRWICLHGARSNNLQSVSVEIPIGLLTFVTGVSGAGKSTLINQTLLPALSRYFSTGQTHGTNFDRIEGLKYIEKVIAIDQKPIGRTPRSNPATYAKVFDLIRDVFANTKEARTEGYNAGRFSFNVRGGRCEVCQGDGLIKVEMHFLPDVYVPCESCRGKRFNEATLNVHFHGKTIADVLAMTVEEARHLFANFPRIVRILDTLIDVGLGYIPLGQPSPSLSGGEAQRVKLARELARSSSGKTLYILDEPTTGLHFDDVRRLLDVLQRLVTKGNTIVVIEHNLDAIMTADYIIDLGPEGGDRGGRVVAAGPPPVIASESSSITGEFLKLLLDNHGIAG